MPLTESERDRKEGTEKILTGLECQKQNYYDSWLFLLHTEINVLMQMHFEHYVVFVCRFESSLKQMSTIIVIQRFIYYIITENSTIE